MMRGRQRGLLAVDAHARRGLQADDQDIVRMVGTALNNINRTGSVNDQPLAAKDVVIVEGGPVVEANGVGEHGAGIDSRVVAYLRGQVEGVGQQALPLRVAPDGPGLL